MKKIITDVPDEYSFHLSDGRSLKNIIELKNALESMNNQLFSYHINDEKNDFYIWIRDIIGDNKLAQDMKKVKNRTQALRVVVQRLTFIKSRM